MAKAIVEEEKASVEAEQHQLQEEQATTARRLSEEVARAAELAAEVGEQNEVTRRMEQDMKMQGAEIEKRLGELEHERAERAEIEGQLKRAEEAVSRLDAALRQTELSAELTTDVGNLKSFFEARINEVERLKQSATLVKNALHAKKEYEMTRSAEGDDE